MSCLCRSPRDLRRRKLLHPSDPIMYSGGRKRISSNERSSVIFKTGIFQDPSSSFLYAPITELRQHTEDPFPVRLVLSVTVIAILIAAIALVMTKVVRTQNGLCSTMACREFAEFARRSLNESVPPCENFGRFVCGRWEKRKSSKASARRLLYATAMETLFKGLTSAGAPLQQQRARERIRAFFSSCSAVTRGERNDASTVRAYLEEAGVTWPLAPSNPDVMDTLLYLDTELYWPSVLQFHAKKKKRVVKVGIEPAMSFRQLADVRARLKARDEKRRYFDVVFRNYGRGVSEERAYNEVEEVEELMAPHLEGAMPRRHDDAQFEEIDIDKLYNDSLNLAERLTKWFGMQSDIKYYTSSEPFLVTFFTLWSQHGDSKMHLYVSWCAVRIAAQFANRDLLRNHYGPDASDLTIRRGCFFLSYQVFGNAIFAEFNAQVFTTEVRHDVRDLVVAVRKSFVRRFSQPSFMDSISLVANWGTMDHVFYVLEGHRHNDLKYAASSLPDMSHSFVTNWRTTSRRVRAFNASLGVLGEDVLSGTSMFHLDRKVKDFILSPFALVFPMYNLELAPSVKYATLGGHVGVATAQLALEHFAQQPAAQLELSRSHQCVKKALEEHAGLPSSTVTELASLSVLLDALAESGDSDQRLSGLVNYTALQTFFIAWCLMRCHDDSPQHDDDDPCSPVLRLFEPFAHAFQCWTGAYMNPSTKCTAFGSPNATI